MYVRSKKRYHYKLHEIYPESHTFKSLILPRYARYTFQNQIKYLADWFVAWSLYLYSVSFISKRHMNRINRLNLLDIDHKSFKFILDCTDQFLSYFWQLHQWKIWLPRHLISELHNTYPTSQLHPLKTFPNRCKHRPR